MIEKLQNEKFARFLGGFVSEGNLVDNGSLKITNQNLDFLNYMNNCVKKVFGSEFITAKPPTFEHKNDKSRFAYHKYFRKSLGILLMKELGMEPGRRILNDEQLPNFIFELPEIKLKNWIKNYMQARFTGDGWVQMSKRWVGLTKVNALTLKPQSRKKLLNLYSRRKQIREYPESFIEELKSEGRQTINFPKEFVQLEEILQNVFYIKSRVRFAGIRTIYFDLKREIFIVSGIYHLLISGDDVTEFKNEINFLELDFRNRKRLDYILKQKNRE